MSDEIDNLFPEPSVTQVNPSVQKGRNLESLKLMIQERANITNPSDGAALEREIQRQSQEAGVPYQPPVQQATPPVQAPSQPASAPVTGINPPNSQPAQSTNWLNQATTALRGYGEGATAGLIKYPQAAIDAGVNGTGNFIDDYKASLAGIRNDNTQMAQNNPAAWYGGNLVGAGALGATTGGGGTLSNVGKMALQGAAQGYSANNGNATDLGDAAKGAGIGATLGTIGSIIPGVANVVKNRLSNTISKETGMTAAEIAEANAGESGTNDVAHGALNNIWSAAKTAGSSVAGGAAGAWAGQHIASALGADPKLGQEIGGIVGAGGGYHSSVNTDAMKALIPSITSGSLDTLGMLGLTNPAAAGKVGQAIAGAATNATVPTLTTPAKGDDIDALFPEKSKSGLEQLIGRLRNNNPVTPSQNQTYAPQAPFASQNQTYAPQKPYVPPVQPPEVHSPSFVTYGGMDDPLPNVRSQTGTITGTPLTGNPYNGWTVDQIANKFGTGKTYLNNLKNNRALQDWDRANNGL